MNPLDPLLWFLPAYTANAAATLSKLFGRTHPVDGGTTLWGNRLLGDGKTWEGVFLGLFSGTATGVLVYYLAGLGTVWGGFLLSLGAILGDMAGSFVKRRVGLERGEEAPVIDQLDFVAGAFLLNTPSPDYGTIILVVTPILHRIANILGHRMGVKREPW